jgi:hypothetical protein
VFDGGKFDCVDRIRAPLECVNRIRSIVIPQLDRRSCRDEHLVLTMLIDRIEWMLPEEGLQRCDARIDLIESAIHRPHLHTAIHTRTQETRAIRTRDDATHDAGMSLRSISTAADRARQ